MNLSASAFDAPEPPAPPATSWESWRERVLSALDEDPLNEALLARQLDRPDRGLLPEQRILAALAGLRLPEAAAGRLLAEALERRERAILAGVRPMPLRLALVDLLLAENRRSPDPLRLELRLGTVPSARGVADPAQTSTESAALLSALQGELRRARRFRHPASVLWIHLDGRADLEAQSGPAAAERALAEASLGVKNEIRDVDWAARTTRGDLVVFLAGTGRLGAVLAANRIRVKLAAQRLPLPGGGAPVTASIGVSAFPDDALFGPDMLASAERAMLRARADGGDGVADADQAPPRRMFRVPAERVRVSVREMVAEGLLEPLPHNDGLVFSSPVPYAVGAAVELECIEVAGSGRALLSGRVVRLEQRLDSGYDIGVACRLEAGEAALIRGEAVRTGS